MLKKFFKGLLIFMMLGLLSGVKHGGVGPFRQMWSLGCNWARKSYAHVHISFF